MNDKPVPKRRTGHKKPLAAIKKSREKWDKPKAGSTAAIEPDALEPEPDLSKPLAGGEEWEVTMARVHDEIRARKPILWDVVHTAIWIATRRIELVDMVVEGHSINTASNVLRKVIQEQSDRWPSQGSPLLNPAVQDLWRKCAEGKIAMSGRLENKGAPSEVPATAWAGLEIFDHWREGVIAAPPDWQRLGVAWWGGLTLKCEQVQRFWPVKSTAAPIVDDETVKIWMSGDIVARRNRGDEPDLPTMVNAARDEFRDRGLGERRARKIYATLKEYLKGKRGPRGPRISRQTG